LGLEERHATAASEAMNLCSRETLERLIRVSGGPRWMISCSLRRTSGAETRLCRPISSRVGS
jgi:hypothetical protein